MVSAGLAGVSGFLSLVADTVLVSVDFVVFSIFLFSGIKFLLLMRPNLGQIMISGNRAGNASQLGTHFHAIFP